VAKEGHSYEIIWQMDYKNILIMREREKTEDEKYNITSL
jgi:hypothetical protein